MEPENSRQTREPGFGSVIFSVLASMFGVQSRRRHQQDFAAGGPWKYVVVGLLATIAFILAVWLLVRIVLHAAGA